MIKIREIQGFKYLGDKPKWIKEKHLGNFRHNMTYMHLSFTKWEEDKKMLFFLEEHISIMEGLIQTLSDSFDSKEYKPSSVHVLIMEDNAEPMYDGRIVYAVSNKKFKGITAEINKWKRQYKLND